MRLKARLYYALLGLNQATGFAGGYDLRNIVTFFFVSFGYDKEKQKEEFLCNI